jgi:hypothetical protein
MYATRKEKVASDFMLGDTSTDKLLSVACIVTEPLDVLSSRLQHLDHETYSAQDRLKSCGCIDLRGDRSTRGPGLYGGYAHFVASELGQRF